MSSAYVICVRKRFCPLLSRLNILLFFLLLAAPDAAQVQADEECRAQDGEGRQDADLVVQAEVAGVAVADALNIGVG